MIDARARLEVEKFDERVIVPRHNENSKKLNETSAKVDQVLDIVSRLKGIWGALALLGPLIAVIINHFWK